MNIDNLIARLNTYIDRNSSKLSKAEVAKKLDMSPSSLSHLLARDFNPTGEQTLAILKLTTGKQSKMNTNTNDESGFQTVNEAILRKYSHNNPATLTHFQSNDGWVPGQSGSDPVDAGSIADLLKSISTAGSDSDVAAKLRKLVNALTRTPSEAVQKAGVNAGPSRSPLNIRSSGERAQIVDNQSFTRNEQNGNVLHLSKGNSLIESCKRDAYQAQQERIDTSHQINEAEVKLERGSTINTDRAKRRGNFEVVRELHAESISASPEEFRANLKRMKECEEAKMRLSTGHGDLSDLRAKFNALKA